MAAQAGLKTRSTSNFMGPQQSAIQNRFAFAERVCVTVLAAFRAYIVEHSESIAIFIRV